VTDLLDVLRHMGYHEVRTAETGEWTPTAETNGQLDGETTDTLHVLVWSDSPTAVLQDTETGETVAEARLSCSVNTSEP